MRRILFIPVIALAHALCASVAACQDTVPVADVLRGADAKLWTVRLTGSEGQVIGRVAEVDRTNVRLVGAKVSLASIERIERQKSSNAMVLPMAIAVGAFGAAIAGIGSQLCDTAACSDDGSTLAMLEGGAVGVALGSLMGALIGRSRTRWIPVWP